MKTSPVEGGAGKDANVYADSAMKTYARSFNGRWIDVSKRIIEDRTPYDTRVSASS